MSPKNIVINAQKAGLDIIAITDHNMVENGFYAHELAKETGTAVLFGMELQTLEEMHLLVIFDDYDTAIDFQKKIYELLPPIRNDTSYFGDQVVVDGNDEIIRFEDRLLLNSSQISIGDAVSWVKTHGGLAIPSHIDSPTFSIISQLGYIPDDIPFDALEVRNKNSIPELLPYIMRKDLPFVTFSDAHYVNDIGIRKTQLYLNEPSCKEIENAFKALG